MEQKNTNIESSTAVNLGEQYLRQPQVLELTGFKKSTLWKFINHYGFPRSNQITPQLSVWRKSEVVAWMEGAITEFKKSGAPSGAEHFSVVRDKKLKSAS